jgi:hypothetical protein
MNGSLPGSTAMMWWRPDGIDVVFLGGVSETIHCHLPPQIECRPRLAIVPSSEGIGSTIYGRRAGRCRGRRQVDEPLVWILFRAGSPTSGPATSCVQFRSGLAKRVS